MLHDACIYDASMEINLTKMTVIFTPLVSVTGYHYDREKFKW